MELQGLRAGVEKELVAGKPLNYTGTSVKQGIFHSAGLRGRDDRGKTMRHPIWHSRLRGFQIGLANQV